MWPSKKKCNHDWNFHGWSYVKCKICEKVEMNERLNADLQAKFWKQAIESGHPMFTKELINSEIQSRGRGLTHSL